MAQGGVCAAERERLTVATREAQLTSAVMMIRPVRFLRNPKTAESNAFQEQTDASPERQQAEALLEFDALVEALRNAGIEVIVFEDTPEPHTPDSVFPNNWVTTHADGRVVLYPMEASNRRTERRLDVIERLGSDYGYQVSDVIDLSSHEDHDCFLEGTGSMVLDRVNRVAYACLSSRTQLHALGDFAQRMDYEVFAFDAVDRNGIPIYHTNVFMTVGDGLAVLCDAAIPNEEQRRAVLARLKDSGHEIIRLSFEQLESFAGNMLQLRAADGARVMAMSEQARKSLTDEQLQRLENNGRIVASPIDRIEWSAGGSVRCMLAELHLPKKNKI